MDLVLALQFPNPKIPEDDGGRIHEQLIECSSRWLKERGVLAMHVEHHLLPRLICSRPSAFQFYRLVCVHYVGHDKESGIVSGMDLNVTWRPYIVFVKGPPETQPLIESGLQTINAKTEMDVARALVVGLSLHGGSVCDPFMGKGIVGKATMAVEGGRKYTGIERDHGLFLSAVDALGGRRSALCVSRTRTLALNTVHRSSSFPESLAQKANVSNNNNDDNNNDKKHEETTTIIDMFLDPTPIQEIVQYSIEEYSSPDKRVKK